MAAQKHRRELTRMDQGSPGNRNFEETRWSLIVKAGAETTIVSQGALAELCQIYWFPVYTYIRRKGQSLEEAQDFTQEFFLRFLEQHYVEDVLQERGKFRSFLMVCINHFLSNEWRKAKAQKRGGGEAHISLDIPRAESLYAESLSANLTPDLLFDRHWAQSVLALALGSVRREYTKAGKKAVFEVLQVVVSSPDKNTSFADLGNELGISEGAARTAAYRLRKRYRELLKIEVSETLDENESVEDELAYLLEALR